MFLFDKIFATGFFSGYAPYAPGTVGSFVAIIIFNFLNLDVQNSVILIAITLAIGAKSSSRLEHVWGKDPGKIVIDEFVGMWISLLGHDMSEIWIVISAFVLFRFFDIVKPLGINGLQKLPDGWGVMVDDVLAGVYANIILWIIIYSI